MGAPVYQQIANLLRASLMDDADKQPRLLPPEQDLAKVHAVALGTIRNALSVLVAEGLIQRTRRRGTLTVPEGIRAWQRMRHSRRIVIHASHLDMREHPQSYFGQVYQGVLVAAEQAGYACSLQQGFRRFPSLAHAVPEDVQRVLGVILVDMPSDGLVAMHAEAGYPVVCVDHLPAHPLADAVCTDCFTEGRQAVDFLVRHGHRELFYIGNLIRRSPREEYQPETDAMQLEAGYRYAVQLAGLGSSAGRTRFTHSVTGNVGELADWIMDQRPRPTGGLVYSIGVLENLLAVLRRRGLCCPEDISLITKTNVSEPTEAAAVYTDGYRLGQTAVRVLQARAAGQEPPGMRVTITSQLRRGNTAGFAPQNVC